MILESCEIAQQRPDELTDEILTSAFNSTISSSLLIYVDYQAVMLTNQIIQQFCHYAKRAMVHILL